MLADVEGVARLVFGLTPSVISDAASQSRIVASSTYCGVYPGSPTPDVGRGDWRNSVSARLVPDLQQPDLMLRDVTQRTGDEGAPTACDSSDEGRSRDTRVRGEALSDEFIAGRQVVRVFILATVRLYREGLTQCLSSVGSMSVVGGSADPIEALDAIRDTRPDVVLLDIGIADGPPIARKIREDMPRTRVVVLAVTGSCSDVICWAKAGVSGYVSRDEAIPDLVVTVERAARGEIVCPPPVVASLLDGLATKAEDGVSKHADLYRRLTARELEIVALIEAGMSNKEIAHTLCIALSTVKNHVHSLLRKLEVAHRFDAPHQMRTDVIRLS